ncbi:ABC transporter transmembrane domain-containing protein, partial [Roseateles sp.]|uniref:ABC transporter transmembrane domain-containing protein n=1 Tax=Roseateles sp. TaxID=1971397 RepID=UPI003BA53C38
MSVEVSLQHPKWAECQSRLLAQENVLAPLEVDLDSQLRFASSLLVLTNRRLLAWDAATAQWAEWSLQADMAMQISDHAGVGALELIQGQGRLAIWRFTLQINLQAQRWQEMFQRRIEQGDVPARETAEDLEFCPSCQAPLPPESEECPTCARELHTPPSTWVLLRLGRFAKPYRKQLLGGFALMLGSTAATLVAPYLTIPLMDRVLIPFQNGQEIDPWLVALILSGLFGAALVSWLLGWAKTYLLSLASERIAADLRTATFDHLLSLSLEYFGNKRTGDLMARIGSETDRISVFLSLHALDFITDVLMLLMTATILFSINPWLALVTLLPLPFIAWMIHLVRDRLRTGFEKIDRVWGEVTSVLADTIPGIRVVKAFAQEKREAQRFREANANNLKVNDKLNRTWSLFTPT